MIDYSLLRGGAAPKLDIVRSSPPSPTEDPLPEEIPLTRIQRLIGRRMLASKRCKPCFYLEALADVTELLAMRHSLSKAVGVKVTSNAFLVHALSLAARQYPLMVGRFVWQDPGNPEAGAVIRIADSINIGFAVSGPQGLVVPVIKNAQVKPLVEIAREEKALTDRARSNRLTLDDLDDQTIGLSNLGAFDIDSFIAIAPPPVSAIVAAGKIDVEAVPVDGRVAVRRLMSLSLTVDRRVVPGVYAARFLHCLTEQLKDPQKLI